MRTVRAEAERWQRKDGLQQVMNNNQERAKKPDIKKINEDTAVT